MICFTMLPFNHRIAQALQHRKAHDLSRSVQAVCSGNTVSLHRGNQSFVNFSSNDYLGLAADKQLAQAWSKGLSLFGNGSAASPLVTGFSPAHQNLESALCDWLGYSRAILFSSGFSANQALLFSVLEKGDLLLQDKRNHASLMEAGLLSPATMKRFRHNDTDHLQKLMTGPALVVTEGVFSMDGDLAPLAEMNTLVRDKSWFMVDDAHGVGIMGEQGRGSCYCAGIQPDLLVVTFGKALGLSGAAILCSEEVGDYLTQFARHHVYSTALPPSQAYALTYAIDMVRTQQWRRDKLAELQDEYDQYFGQFEGYQMTTTPIKPLLLGESQRALRASEALKQSGHWLTAIRPPTVANNSARLRITLSANHTRQHIRALAHDFEKTMEKVN
ncbi:8-amino-7-oxononanoate synthase [Vibrio ostreicida]